VETEGDPPQDLVVAEFRQVDFGGSVQQFPRKAAFRLDRRVDLFLDRAPADEFMDEDVLRRRLQRQNEERDPLVLLEILTSNLRFRTSISPCSVRPGRPKRPARSAASGSITARNWVKTSIFSWREAITSAISRRRSPLPLSYSFHA
jgi:hypothetical protein